MPRGLGSVLPRIRASIARRGVMMTLFRSVLAPMQLAREYRARRTLRKKGPPGPRSDFDVTHGVETDGDFGGWTYLDQLNIPSPNWIHGVNYTGIEPARFWMAMLSVDLTHEEFLFVDFGSGKGRALLMASEFPFRKVIGIEFSPELHAIAQKNIRQYRRGRNGCDAVESVCMDFIDFALPPEPSVLFFYEPCDEVLFVRVLDRIRDSLREHPRPLHLIYVSPGRKEALLDAADFLVKQGRNAQFQFCWYKAG